MSTAVAAVWPSVCSEFSQAQLGGAGYPCDDAGAFAGDDTSSAYAQRASVGIVTGQERQLPMTQRRFRALWADSHDRHCGLVQGSPRDLV